MQQSAVSPKISLSIDVKQVLDLVQSLQKDTSSKQNQRLNVDIYLGPNPDAPPSPSVPSHEGPHEVNRGSWAMVPPSVESSLLPSLPASTRRLPPTPAPQCEPTPLYRDGSTSGGDASRADMRSGLSMRFGSAPYSDIAKFARGVYSDLSLAHPGPDTEATWRMLAALWEYCATERFAEFPELRRVTLEHRNICLQRLEELQNPM